MPISSAPARTAASPLTWSRWLKESANAWAPGASVLSAEGARISEPDEPGANVNTPYGAPSPDKQKELLAEAIETARKADVVVLALGGNETVSREAFGDSVGLGLTFLGDTDDLRLPGNQDELVREIVKIGKPTAAVLLNGRPYLLKDLSQRVPAILEGWYLGQETGNALAGVLFGDVNPSGHLPVTLPANEGQLPVYYYRTPAARLDYVFAKNAPLFPFGHGLSYTSFSFGKPPSTEAASVPVRRRGSPYKSRTPACARATMWSRCTCITTSAAWFSRSRCCGDSSASALTPGKLQPSPSTSAMTSWRSSTDP